MSAPPIDQDPTCKETFLWLCCNVRLPPGATYAPVGAGASRKSIDAVKSGGRVTPETPNASVGAGDAAAAAPLANGSDGTARAAAAAVGGAAAAAVKSVPPEAQVVARDTPIVQPPQVPAVPSAPAPAAAAASAPAVPVAAGGAAILARLRNQRQQSGSQGSSAAGAAAGAAAGPKVVFTYGSQTGTAQEIAKALAAEAASRGVKCEVLSLNELGFNNVSASKTPVLVVVASSTGDGDPPDNALKAFAQLVRMRGDAMAGQEPFRGVRYTVFGLGDSNYTSFMRVPRAIKSKLAELGGKEFYRCAEADEVDGIENTVEPWQDGLWGPLQAALEQVQAEQQGASGAAVQRPASAASSLGGVISAAEQALAEAAACKSVAEKEAAEAVDAELAAQAAAEAAAAAAAAAKEAEAKEAAAREQAAAAKAAAEAASRDAAELAAEAAKQEAAEVSAAAGAEAAALAAAAKAAAAEVQAREAEEKAATEKAAKEASEKAAADEAAAAAVAAAAAAKEVAEAEAAAKAAQEAQAAAELAQRAAAAAEAEAEAIATAAAAAVAASLQAAGSVTEHATSGKAAAVATASPRGANRASMDASNRRSSLDTPRGARRRGSLELPAGFAPLHQAHQSKPISVHFPKREETVVPRKDEQAYGMNLGLAPMGADTKGAPALVPCRIKLAWEANEARAKQVHVLEDSRPTQEDLDYRDPEGVYSPEKPFWATISAARYETAPWSDRKVLHLEFSIAGSGMRYKPGDALGVAPRNSPDLVDKLIKRLAANGDRVFTVHAADGSGKALLQHIPRQCSVWHALYCCLDITSPPRKSLLRLLAEHSSDAAEKRTLMFYCSRAGKDAYAHEILEHQPSLLDLLVRFPSCSPPLDALLDALPPLMPRLYSVTCCQECAPGTVQVALSLVRFKTRYGTRPGVATTWLDRRAQPLALEGGAHAQVPPARPVPLFLKRSKDFAPPPDLATPMIMIGPGTGVAPFRGFLQHRKAEAGRKGVAASELGEAWLFFGCRRDDEDFLYKDDLQGFAADGTLTQLRVAFSRAQADKVYVQDLLRQDAAKVYELIRKGGHVYVCGDGAAMAKDVHAALLSIIVSQGGVEEAVAAEQLAAMTQERRYIRDVWS